MNFKFIRLVRLCMFAREITSNLSHNKWIDRCHVDFF